MVAVRNLDFIGQIAVFLKTGSFTLPSAPCKKQKHRNKITPVYCLNLQLLLGVTRSLAAVK